MTKPPLVGQWADAGGGREPRGGLLQCLWGRGRLGLASGLTQAAGAGRKAGAFLLVVTWPHLAGRWADTGGGLGLRGGRLQCRWATWPPVVGRRAEEGRRRGSGGGRL